MCGVAYSCSYVLLVRARCWCEKLQVRRKTFSVMDVYQLISDDLKGKVVEKITLLTYYYLYIRPLLGYASDAWPKLPPHLRGRMERLHRCALKKIIRKPDLSALWHHDLLLTLNQASLQSRKHYQSVLVGFHLPTKQPQNTSWKVVASAQGLISLFATITFSAAQSHFQPLPVFTVVFCITCFYLLPKHIQSSTRLSQFKKKAQQYFLSPSYLCTCSMHDPTSM